MRRWWWFTTFLILAFASGVVLGGWLAAVRFTGPPQPVQAAQLGGSGVVRLAANRTLRSVEARILPWQETLTVSGRVDYDQTRRVEIPATTSAVVLNILVQPGQQVSAGQVLAELSSSEVAAVRSELLLRDEELALAEEQFRWDATTYTNVQELVAALQSRPQVEQLEAQFRDRILGRAREQLLAAYARWRAAEQLVSSAQPLAEEGTLPRPTLVERQLELHKASAELRGLCEQVTFQLKQVRDQARIARNEAQRRRDIAEHRLSTLLGYQDSIDAWTTQGDLSRYEVRSPASFTVERRYKAAAERVTPGEPLFLLADTSHLWVRAEVREQDWWKIKVEPGQYLRVQFPGMPHHKLKGRIVYIGREASRDSRAIPLVLMIENADHRFRPGMYAQVIVPVGSPRPVLQIPEPAVVRHQGQTFVFVASSDGSWQRRDVECLSVDGEMIPIVSGLSEGERVAVEDVFLLKSALLLESETE